MSQIVAVAELVLELMGRSVDVGISRTNKVRNVCKQLAIECLGDKGFAKICDYSLYADVVAEREGVRYFISVRSRNEERKGGGINSPYNLLKISKPRNDELKRQGKTRSMIAKILIDEENVLASDHGAIAAWVTIPIRPEQRSYAAFFGLLKDLGIRLSIPMKPKDYSSYEMLSDWTVDERITEDMKNK